MKPEYYFKFVVPSHYAIEHNTFKEAVKTAKEQLEPYVYLTIYSYKNVYREPYSEERLLLNTDSFVIDCAKRSLIKTFEKLTQ